MYDARIGRTPSPDPHATSYPYMSPYCYSVNNPIYFIDQDGRDPEPSAELINAWFKPRKKLINKIANKYDIETKFIAAVLFRENQNFMSSDKTWTRLWIAKESVAMFKANMMADYEGDLDRWSSGIAQMQVKLVVRMKYDMTVEQYDEWKSKLNSTEEGKLEYQNIIDEAIVDMFDNEKAVDYLGKYIKQLLEQYPESTPEQIIEDYARGTHNSRSENKTVAGDDLKEDIARYQEFQEAIKESVSDENEDETATK